ncbi:cupin domain-containing protein [Streptomyces sp. RGM 3693]|uniref:cupin domain-containing protein n=1 Tax=Streptomyces sp. RGM 3693 TaxID=3413284 RepID=UPI003D26AFF9
MSKDRFYLLDANASRTARAPLPPGVTLKAGAGDTQGRFTLMEVRGKGGNGVPTQVPPAKGEFTTHDPARPSEVSHPSDTFIYVLDGDLGIDVDGRTHHLTSGMCALLPSGVDHALHNLGGADSLVHTLQLTVPGDRSDDPGDPRRCYVLDRGAVRPGRIAVPPAFGIKARTTDTAGRFSFLEVTVAQPIPLHTHHGADECIYVLDGALHIDFDGRVHTAGRGQFVLLPHGVPHAIRPGSTPPPRVLQISSPGGWECVVETLIEHRAEVSRAGRFDPAALNRYTRQYHVTYEEEAHEEEAHEEG